MTDAASMEIRIDGDVPLEEASDIIKTTADEYGRVRVFHNSQRYDFDSLDTEDEIFAELERGLKR